MNRRNFMLVMLLASLAMKSKAVTVSFIHPKLGPAFRSYVPYPTYIQQDCPLWCWAASISMIFSHYNHPVSQNRIVDTIFGKQVCTRATNSAVIVNALNTRWIDDAGKPFTSQVSALADSNIGVSQLNNEQITQYLDANKPLIYCNTHHCMVLISVEYIMTSKGPDIIAAGVMDPFPGVSLNGFRVLESPELSFAPRGQATLIAAVDVA